MPAGAVVGDGRFDRPGGGVMSVLVVGRCLAVLAAKQRRPQAEGGAALPTTVVHGFGPGGETADAGGLNPPGVIPRAGSNPAPGTEIPRDLGTRCSAVLVSGPVRHDVW